MSEINKEQSIFFAGKKMTIQDFIAMYDLSGESDESVNIILTKLEKKGKVRYLNESTDPSEKAFESISKDLDLDATLAQMEEDADRAEKYRVDKNREGRLTYEEVEIDFPTLVSAEDFCHFAQDKLHLEAGIVERDNTFVLILKDITEQDLSVIKRRKGFDKLSTNIFRATDKVAESTINATSFATEKVIVPTTKATLKTALGLTKSLVKTGAQVGSSLVTSTTESTRSMKEELSKDRDVLRAKRDLVDAKDAVLRMFKRSNKSSGVRIK